MFKRNIDRIMSHLYEPILKGRIVIFFLLLITSCGPSNNSKSNEDKPIVVTSFFPLYDFARQLAGDQINVTCLTPPGADPHSVELTPSMVKTTHEAQLILMLGFGLDAWIDKIPLKAGQKKLRVSDMGIETIANFHPSKKQGMIEMAVPKNEENNPTVDADPHVWLDPIIAQKIVAEISDQFEELDPSSKQLFHKRKDELLNKLKLLHAEFSSKLKDFTNPSVVTFHGAFGYLFKRYEIQLAGVVELFPGDEPSVSYLKKLVNLMRKLKINVIFAEPQLPDRPAIVIAKEINGRVEKLDPCETILPESPDTTYLQRQMRNLATLSKVLSEGAKKSDE